MLVLNGDVLTRVDFRAMVAFHREHAAELTVGVRQYDFQVPYGVIQCDGPRVRGIEEKPTLNFFVNAGIYLLEPSAHRSIPAAQKFDMTDLIEKLKMEGRNVVAFPVDRILDGYRTALGLQASPSGYSKIRRSMMCGLWKE